MTLAQITIHGRVLRAEVADTMVSRARGLSGREKLGPDEAMLFTFPLAMRYSFWMKGMKFPLDIIWIRKGIVADISENIPAPAPGASVVSILNSKAKPKVAVDMVLETNAGLVRELGIKMGDKVEVAQVR